MPDFDRWLGTSSRFAPQTSARASAAWRRIQDKPSAVTLKRGTTLQTAQTMRVEIANSASEQRGVNATPGQYTAVLFGVRGHASVADTDIQRGDQVVLSGRLYEVVSVIETIGEVQAVCEVRDTNG